MPTYYLQEGLRPLPPRVERNTWSDTPGVFLDDRLHTFNKVENQLLATYIAPDWIQAREQVEEHWLPSWFS